MTIMEPTAEALTAGPIRLRPYPEPSAQHRFPHPETFSPAPQVPLPAPVPASPVMQTSEPMVAVFQGVDYAIAHWDVRGFTLASPFPRALTPGHGRIIDFALLIGTGSTRIEMRVCARAAEIEDGQAHAFRFVELDRAQAETLHRIVDHALNRQALSITQLLNETDERRTLRHQTEAQTLSFRTRFQTGLALLAIFAAGLTAFVHFTTVKSRFAAVTAAAVSVSATAPGTVGVISVRPGQRVHMGEPLGAVRPADHAQRLQALADRRRGLEDEQAQLRARRDTLTQIGGLAGTNAEEERLRLEEALRLADRRLSVEQSQLATLRANGLPTAGRQRERAQQEAVVLSAQQEVLAARTRLAALAQAEALMPMGIIAGGPREGLATFEALDLRLAHLATEIATLDQRLAQSAQGEPVLSPCDCTVQSIERRVGEWSQATEPLFVLSGETAPTVHALVMADAARRIAQGDRARIELADGTSTTGRITRLNYEAHWPGYAGLRDSVFAAERFARVEIAPDQPLSAPVGMTARVGIDTDERIGWLRRWAGL